MSRAFTLTARIRRNWICRLAKKNPREKFVSFVSTHQPPAPPHLGSRGSNFFDFVEKQKTKPGFPATLSLIYFLLACVSRANNHVCAAYTSTRERHSNIVHTRPVRISPGSSLRNFRFPKVFRSSDRRSKGFVMKRSLL